MGKCVVHMQKFKASDCGGIQSHVQREHKSKTNPNIDYAKSHLNHTIWSVDNLLSLVKHQIRMNAPQTVRLRKDAVMVCGFIVSSDADTLNAMPREMQIEFFKDTVTFFSLRYGCENIAYASVHYDEPGAPHLHIGVVPIKDGKLCAKELFNATELRSLQTDFWLCVGRKYGLDRGEENSKAKHLTEAQFKAKMADEKVKAAEERLVELEKSISAADKALERKNAEGVGQFGMIGWKERIAAMRDQENKNRQLFILQKFIDLPFIKPLWEKFLQDEQDRPKRVKTKNGHQRGS